ncbi:hypothetical protein B0H14DRAFT_3901185 [Mycena olivaceomarginata]|nr:hypothetical protein B0H14DRAFT_3901185 [Mycena olivaceomarginata]
MDHYPTRHPVLPRRTFVPGARAHILLDRLGKTQSHAFRRAAFQCCCLRRSPRASTVQPQSRAMVAEPGDVTLTLSSPAALMAALLTPLSVAQRPFLLVAAPPGTHTCNSELMVLISLIRTPNPRFVKTPSLPFYLLTSMLSKIPADGDRHLLWTGSGILYDITITAIQVLLAREPEAVDRVLSRTSWDSVVLPRFCLHVNPRQ